MFFLCDSTELRALETLIQSQHHYNLLVHRWLIRNLVCIILLFSERRVLSVILITKIPFFFSPLFSSFLPDSVLLLSGGCSKIFKAGSYSPIFKREEMAIIFALFQDKKINKKKMKWIIFSGISNKTPFYQAVSSLPDCLKFCLRVKIMSSCLSLHCQRRKKTEVL